MMYKHAFLKKDAGTFEKKYFFINLVFYWNSEVLFCYVLIAKGKMKSKYK